MARKTNIEVNGKSYYRVTKTIGHRADGTAIRKQFYGSGVNEANQKADEYIKNLKMGLLNDNQLHTINTLLPKWLFDVKKNEIKASSFESYESTYRNFIKPYLIADLPINELKSLKIQEFYNKLIKEKVSANTVKKTHKLLRQFFSYSEKEGYIIKNPCINVSLPKKKKEIKNIIKERKTKFQYFNEDEIKQLIELFKNTRYENIIIFALGTGMRKGEILGLQWEDIDFENKEIHVVHNLSYIANINENGARSYTTILQTPKSENSIRIIPMSQKIYDLLKSIDNNSDYVFSSRGSHFDIKWTEKFWNKTLKGTNLEGKKFHDLRHTFATMLLLNGANLIQIKELLGHSSVKITEMYLDALPKSKQEIVNKIDYLIS